MSNMFRDNHIYNYRTYNVSHYETRRHCFGGGFNLELFKEFKHFMSAVISLTFIGLILSSVILTKTLIRMLSNMEDSSNDDTNDETNDDTNDDIVSTYHIISLIYSLLVILTSVILLAQFIRCLNTFRSRQIFLIIVALQTLIITVFGLIELIIVIGYSYKYDFGGIEIYLSFVYGLVYVVLASVFMFKMHDDNEFPDFLNRQPLLAI